MKKVEDYKQNDISYDLSSRFKDKLIQAANSELENHFKDLFIKFDILYQSIAAAVYIIVHKADEFSQNDSTEMYDKFTAILKRYNKSLNILDFIPKDLLYKLRDVHPKISDDIDFLNMLTSFIQDLTSEERGFQPSDLLEDYLPFDPNFLHYSKKALEPNYHYMGMTEAMSLEARYDDFDEANPNEDGNVNARINIEDTINDFDSDVLSIISKHETDTSNGNIPIYNEVNSKRKLETEDHYGLEKKVKKENPNLNANISVN